MRSVSFMASEPILVRLRIVLSTSSSVIPSIDVTTLLSIAIKADNVAVETPLDTLSAQLGFAQLQVAWE